jgi:putative alpha-1,2-mannosidase
MAIKLANDKNLSENVALSETGQTKQEILDTGNYLLRRSENFQKIFDTTEGFFRAKDGGGNFLTLDGEPFDPLK